MARRRIPSETGQTREEMESEEKTATPSSWWEERETIKRPSPEDQEMRYREEQERFEQERQRESYYNKPIQELLREEEPRGDELPIIIRRGDEPPIRIRKRGRKTEKEAGE